LDILQRLLRTSVETASLGIGSDGVVPNPAFEGHARWTAGVLEARGIEPGFLIEELERHFRERSGLVDAFPGFLYLQLLKPQAGDATHTFLTAWEGRESFRRYMKSRGAAISHGREPGEIVWSARCGP